MRVLGLVCAREGSKGVAGKNIRRLAGKPLISWTLAVAKECPSIDRVVVSTDGQEIARVAREAGADVPFMRPPELARDDTLQIDAIHHAVGELENEGDIYDAVALLQPTAPLRRVDEVEGCIAMMRETTADTVISVMAVEDGGPRSIYTRDELGRVKPLSPSNKGGTLRQTMPPLYVRTGSVYLIKRRLIVEERSLYGDDVRGYVCPPQTAFNIDTEFDWSLTEAWIAWLERNNVEYP